METEAPGAATGKPGHTERQRRTVTQCAENCKPDGRLPFKSCSRYPTTPAFAGELCQKLPHRSELPAPGPCSQSLSTQRPAINTTASLEATKTEVQEAETVSDLTPHVETDFEKEVSPPHICTQITITCNLSQLCTPPFLVSLRESRFTSLCHTT